MGGNQELSGPDLAQGIPLSDLEDGGKLLGHSGGEPVLVVRQRRGGLRRRRDVYALRRTARGGDRGRGHGPLPVASRLLQPAHGRGGAGAGPEPGGVLPGGARGRPDHRPREGRERAAARGFRPRPVVIVGAGAAGNAAAEELRRQGHDGRIVLIGPETEAPYDRPNLSKDYLAGNAPEEWIPLHPRDFYDERRIELLLGAEVTALDPQAKTVTLSDGRSLEYGALILATGAEPVRLPLPGSDRPHVHSLRSLADSRAIIAKAKEARRAVVVGASFIGLEAAAVAAGARRGGDRGVARRASPREGDGPGARRLHPRPARGARRPVPARDEAEGFRRGRGRARERRVRSGRSGRRRRRRAPAARPGGGGGARGGQRRAGRRVPGDERFRCLRGGGHRPLARSAFRASASASSTGWWPSARGRPPRATSSDGGSASTPFPSSGASTTTSRSPTSGTRRSGMRSRSQDRSPSKSVTAAFRSGGRIAAVATIFRDQESLEAELAMERGDEAALEAVVAR